MPLYKLTSARLARKEKAERIAAKAEDSDASSVSEMESEDSVVLSDEDGESASGASWWTGLQCTSVLLGALQFKSGSSRDWKGLEGCCKP